jgi:hypothetical protein
MEIFCSKTGFGMSLSAYPKSVQILIIFFLEGIKAIARNYSEGYREHKEFSNHHRL